MELSKEQKNQLKEVLKPYTDSQFCNTFGRWTVRKGFYYTHGGSAEKVRNEVMAAALSAGFVLGNVECGKKWFAFRGGAKLANQSHWWVQFTVERVIQQQSVVA